MGARAVYLLATAGMRIGCASPIRPLCGIYKSAPKWRKSANGRGVLTTRAAIKARYITINRHFDKGKIKIKPRDKATINATTKTKKKINLIHGKINLIGSPKKLIQSQRRNFFNHKEASYYDNDKYPNIRYLGCVSLCLGPASPLSPLRASCLPCS
jgi:hypothetical protein